MVVGPGHLLARDERLVEFLTVTGADDADLGLGTEEFDHCPSEDVDRAGRGLLNEDVTRLCVLEGVKDEIDRFLERHQEPGHAGIGEGDRLPLLHLPEEQRDHRPA